MVESEKHISPIEWDRNSEDNSMEDNEQDHNNEIKEIQRICNQSSPHLDTNFRLPTKIKYLFQESRYFLIKSNNFENISLAKARNVWSTTRSNEVRLNKAFYETKNVLLIFSVKESGKFQGYARLATPSNPKKHINWVLPSHMSQRQLSGIFEIDWLSREDVLFTKTNHLVNAWNEHKPVKIGRDGQEIEPSCGEFLCRLFPIDEDCPFNDIIEKAKCGRSEYTNRDSRNNDPSSTTFEARGSDNYSQKMLPQLGSYGDYGYGDHRSECNQRRRSSRSRSKREREAYCESSRSRDRHRRENSNVFLNGVNNYEDYLREQDSCNRVYNQFSYEQRVDEFLRNIVTREAVKKQQLRDSSSEYSRSTSSSYKRKRRRSRSYERRSHRSHKAAPTKRYKSRSRHRH